jgi:hypothetical protein
MYVVSGFQAVFYWVHAGPPALVLTAHGMRQSGEATRESVDWTREKNLVPPIPRVHVRTLMIDKKKKTGPPRARGTAARLPRGAARQGYTRARCAQLERRQKSAARGRGEDAKISILPKGAFAIVDSSKKASMRGRSGPRTLGAARPRGSPVRAAPPCKRVWAQGAPVRVSHVHEERTRRRGFAAPATSGACRAPSTIQPARRAPGTLPCPSESTAADGSGGSAPGCTRLSRRACHV